MEKLLCKKSNRYYGVEETFHLLTKVAYKVLRYAKNQNGFLVTGYF